MNGAIRIIHSNILQVNIQKTIYLNCREGYEDMIDRRSYTQLYTQVKQLWN